VAARRWYAHLTDIALSALASVTAYRWITSDSTGALQATAVTASRIVASDSNGLPTANASLTSGRLVRADGTGSLTSNAALTASRLMVSDGSGFPASNQSLTNNRLVYSDAAGSVASNAALTQNRVVIGDANGLPTPAAAITASRALISDANGVPTHSSLTSANLANVAHTVSDTSSIDLTLSSGTLSADVKSGGVSLAMLAGGTGSWVFVTSATASGSASITFTDLTTYDAYKVVMYDVASANDAVNLLWRASVNNGSSYDATANYGWAAVSVDSAGTVLGAGSGGDTSIRLAGTMGNADTTEAGSGIFYLIHRGSGSTVSRIRSDFAYRSSVPSYINFSCGGSYNVGNDVDAMQFLMSAGNISRGSFRLYGLRQS
jgi:hypothetical protein